MLVYRDNSRTVSGALLLERLRRLLLDSGSDERLRLERLLSAAELECALADAWSPAREPVQTLADELALAWLDGADRTPCPETLSRLSAPEVLTITRPEGYAYYALEPRTFADLAAAHAFSSERVLVVGIRSIGASLSAVVKAALSRRGIAARRFTVRPSGHPWARRLSFAPSELAVLEAWPDAECVVVDEGPGLSGATFLAAAEALETRFPAARIVLFTSRAADPARLVAPDAARRWARFRSVAAAPASPPAAGLDWSGGRWREHVYSSQGEWPASWTTLERVKVVTGARQVLKFSGVPPYDRESLERGRALYEAGFAPALRPAGLGFLAQDWCEGRPARGDEPRREIIERIASYLCFRSRAFPEPESDVGALTSMLRVNLEEAGISVELPSALPCEHPVVTDARLLPHEWIVTGDGTLLKTDGTDHGDDHLFPGPCDVAWDLAGAVVEWQLDGAERAALLGRYRQLSGDDARPRLRAYELAYAAFRLGCCELARLSGDDAERSRLASAAARYRANLHALVESAR